MTFNLLPASMIAATAQTTAAINEMVIAMSTSQSPSTNIERAATWQTYVFVGYVFLLLLTLVGTILLYKAGNRYQEAVKSDADARIVEAGERASNADARAGEANERAGKLEHDNLTLRGQVATLETQAADAKKDVAGLQKAAADAKAAQQRVEIELSNAVAQQQRIQTELARQQERAANAEERAANAERNALELQDTIFPRSFSRRYGNNPLVSATLKFRGTKVVLKYTRKCWDCEGFAKEIAEALKVAGWTIVSLTPTDEPLMEIGLSIKVGLSKDSGNEVLAAIALTEGLLTYELFDLGFWSMQGTPAEISGVPPDTVLIEVSPHPFTGILDDVERKNRKDRLADVRRRLEFARQQFEAIKRKQN